MSQSSSSAPSVAVPELLDELYNELERNTSPSMRPTAIQYYHLYQQVAGLVSDPKYEEMFNTIAPPEDDTAFRGASADPAPLDYDNEENLSRLEKELGIGGTTAPSSSGRITANLDDVAAALAQEKAWAAELRAIRKREGELKALLTKSKASRPEVLVNDLAITQACTINDAPGYAVWSSTASYNTVSRVVIDSLKLTPTPLKRSCMLGDHEIQEAYYVDLVIDTLTIKKCRFLELETDLPNPVLGAYVLQAWLQHLEAATQAEQTTARSVSTTSKKSTKKTVAPPTAAPKKAAPTKTAPKKAASARLLTVEEEPIQGFAAPVPSTNNKAGPSNKGKGKAKATPQQTAAPKSTKPKVAPTTRQVVTALGTSGPAPSPAPRVKTVSPLPAPKAKTAQIPQVLKDLGFRPA